MSIRFKIALLFTFLVSCLLLISFWSINTWLASKNKSQFQQRLKNRSISVSRLWTISDTLIRTVLRNLDSGAIASLENKYVAIYDDSNKIHYRHLDSPNDTATIAASDLKVARDKGETFFTIKEREGYILKFANKNKIYYIALVANNEYGRKVKNDLNSILWVISFAGFFLAFLSGWFFSYYILKPISRIVKEVNQFSSDHLSNRISAGNPKDELNALAETFNKLLDRLEESFLTQRRFISNASHELSTPLTSMSSQIEVGLMQKRSEKEYEHILRSVSDEVHVMQDLTKSLLEIARTGSEGTIELTDVRVDETLIKAMAHVRKAFPDYRVELNFSDLPEDENECIVPGNPDLLYTAFKNIIENGCKYSDDKKTIVDLNFKENKILIDFLNKGDVIAEEEIEKIFQPFFRGTGSSGKSGFGLGLSLTKRIIQLHNGKLNAQSDPVHGTRFHIELISIAAF